MTLLEESPIRMLHVIDEFGECFVSTTHRKRDGLAKSTVDPWQGILGDQELTLYRTAMTERLDSGLAQWLEHGRL
jgi:hypothetical protein